MLYGLTLGAAAVGVLITAYLVAVCWGDPVDGLRRLQHEPGKGDGMGMLPKVMLGRYIGFLIMAVGALLVATPAIVFILTVGLTFMAWYDTILYRRAGLPYDRHAMAAGAGTLISLISGIAWIYGAAA
ncbi:hypothetical protein [Pseudaestuariivita atlantica]|uniref:Uncharacterized protein n=1 Tax=Pseudaestuariivita atlantica TaxID=1317121 RepID=A0A0L1JL99_9RHOB|nr:hypothetical protein [Pseudaestuariivita atlantica]KNG92487.1 hypothetical protein ATO11_17955 [Pseudaestuariivita atlantica]